jgi:YidC/Oxa1 family membrane protein insertase
VSFLNPLFEAVAWVMMQIHRALAVPFGASSGVTWALTIIILVVLMRLAMVPLFIKQRNSMQKMQSHMPQLQEIRKRYKNDKTRLNEETMKFYKENGINPLGGCLPLVAQLPVFWALFNVLRAVASWTPPAAGQVASPPKYGMSVAFVESAHKAKIFGISLYDQFLHPVAGETSTSRYLIVVFVLISAATTFLTMRQSQKRGMMNQTAPDPDQPGAAAAQAMSKNMMYIAPFFALTGLYWQFGLVLYWVTTNIWTLGQQHFLFRNLPTVGSATAGSATAAAGSSAAKPVAARSAGAKPAAARSAGAKPPAARSAGAKPSAAKSAAAKPSAAKSVAAKSAAKPAGEAVQVTCLECGAESADGTEVCARCGAPVGDQQPSVRATSAKNGTSSTPGAKSVAKSAAGKPTSARPAGKASTAKSAEPAAKPAEVKANGAAANGAASGSGGSSMLRRFGRGKEEPQDVPAAPPTKVVRQQPVRQTRSKRGNSGKR